MSRAKNSQIIVAAALATATPLANGTAAVGVSTLAAREDHVHPISLQLFPVPYLSEIIPDSYLPSTTGNFKLKGSFFTTTMTVTTLGGVVNYMTFINSHEVDVNITTGATEGSFSVTIDNGISKTFNDVLLINLGVVIKPLTAEWTLTEPINVADDEVYTQTYNSTGSAIWSQELDYTRNWSLRFKFKKTPLGFPTVDTGYTYKNLSLINVSNGIIRHTLSNRVYTPSNRYVYSFIIGSGSYGTTFQSVGFDNFEGLEYRYVNGILYFYKNGILITQDNAPSFGQNLKVKILCSYIDIVDIKYIELA